MESTNSSLKQQLQELQEKLDNSQLREKSEISALNSQLAACKVELAKEAEVKGRIQAEMETFKGNFKYTVVPIKTYDTFELTETEQATQ